MRSAAGEMKSPTCGVPPLESVMGLSRVSVQRPALPDTLTTEYTRKRRSTRLHHAILVCPMMGAVVVSAPTLIEVGPLTSVTVTRPPSPLSSCGHGTESDQPAPLPPDSDDAGSVASSETEQSRSATA